MGETGRYLYAVSRDLDPAALAGSSGLGGGSLELVGYQDLVAVVSSVDLDEYGEDGLRANLENLEWLEEAARGHDAVIQAVAAAGPAAPLRLATICLDDEAVRRRLQEWHPALVQILDRVQGRTEWSVKIFTDERRPARAPASAKDLSGKVGTGAAYLQRKKLETASRVAEESAAQEVVEQVHQTLARHAEATRLLPPQDPRLTGHEGTMLHNGAYLVETLREPDFVACVLRLVAAHPDVTIDLRGPWAPYSFAMLEQR